MFTFLYYSLPVSIIVLCVFGILLLYGGQVQHVRSLRFTIPLAFILMIIGITLSTWTPLAPFPFYQQHLQVQKVNKQYKTAEVYLDSLVNKGLFDLNTTVKKHVTHHHFLVVQKKINQIDDLEKRSEIKNKSTEYLAIYENHIGNKIIQQIQLEHLNISEYGNLTAQDYDNVRYQIQQQIQDPQTEKAFLNRVSKLQKEHDIQYHPVAQ